MSIDKKETDSFAESYKSTFPVGYPSDFGESPKHERNTADIPISWRMLVSAGPAIFIPDFPDTDVRVILSRVEPLTGLGPVIDYDYPTASFDQILAVSRSMQANTILSYQQTTHSLYPPGIYRLIMVESVLAYNTIAARRARGENVPLYSAEILSQDLTKAFVVSPFDMRAGYGDGGTLRVGMSNPSSFPWSDVFNGDAYRSDLTVDTAALFGRQTSFYFRHICGWSGGTVSTSFEGNRIG